MKKSFRLEGLCCANCAAKIERKIAAIPGVTQVSLNFMTTKLVLESEDERMEEILALAEKAIHKIEPDVVMKKA